MMNEHPTRKASGVARRNFLVLAGAGFSLSCRLARADTYPARPITMVVPFPPGGGFDNIARPFSERFGKALNQTIVIDNRAGSGGNIGADMVARATPDGYTLLFGNDFLATNPNVNKNVRYDPVKDFAMIGMIGTTQVIVAVRPEFPARNFAELVALSKAKPLTYGTPGIGTSPHLLGEYLASTTSLKLLHVPYKGTGPAVTDTMGGQIDMVLATTPSVTSFIRSGKLRGIAIVGDRHSPQLPEIPTLREAGGPQIDYDVWYCLAVPASTPESIQGVLRSAAKLALDPELGELLLKQGYEMRTGSPDEINRVLRRDLARWHDVVEKAKITVD
jgi:tripartite-type tricarboxylate transporter receptor subunit TctC